MRKPVFRSCDVLPAFAVATATTAAIEIALYPMIHAGPPHGDEDHARAQERRDGHAGMGFAEDPICPVTREETVAKKKPKITIRTAQAG